jgi:hypothetical protein
MLNDKSLGKKNFSFMNENSMKEEEPFKQHRAKIKTGFQMLHEGFSKTSDGGMGINLNLENNS